MKQIVMMQGLGNNEQGWARLVSKFGRVTLIQQGMTQHVEVWENEQRVFNGPLNARWAAFPDLTTGERFTVVPAIALMFVLGIFPQVLITLFNQTVLKLLP